MQLEAALRKRRMTRRFSPSPIEPARLDSLLDLARHVPSAGFAQGVDMLVLTGEADRQRFWAAGSEARWRARSPAAPGLLAAPAIVLPLAAPATYGARYGEADKAASGLAGLDPERWPVPYWLVDAAFVSLALLLAAEGAGLGALFFRLHGDEAALLQSFGVPAGWQAIGAVALGERHPADVASGSPQHRRRRPLEELVHRGSW